MKRYQKKISNRLSSSVKAFVSTRINAFLDPKVYVTKSDALNKLHDEHVNQLSAIIYNTVIDSYMQGIADERLRVKAIADKSKVKDKKRTKLGYGKTRRVK